MNRQYRREFLFKVYRHHSLAQRALSLDSRVRDPLSIAERIEFQELSHALAPLDVIGLLLDELALARRKNELSQEEP